MPLLFVNLFVSFDDSLYTLDIRADLGFFDGPGGWLLSLILRRVCL
jgi:hypothetical protein